MSQDITSILLPASRVDVFALDDSTAVASEGLAGDWRFARVGVSVARGGIEAAIAKYSQEASPEMVVIETNDISDAFIQQLGSLAGVCATGTDAVIVGPTNDVRLYRSLVEMGVRDYLVRPLSQDDLVKVISKALVEKHGISGSRLISVIGGKGGVGVTSVAQIIAWNIAEDLKHKTLLMDAAGAGGTLGIAYGVEPTTSLSEAVRLGASGSEDDMKRIVQKAGENLSLLVCGGSSILDSVSDAPGMEKLVDRLMQKSPIVVMDLSGASTAVQKAMLARSSHVVVVSTPVLSALRNARTLVGELKTMRSGLKQVDMVITMQGFGGSDEVPAADIKKVLDVDVAAGIPFAPKAFVGAEAAGKISAQSKSGQDIARALMKVSMRACGDSQMPAHEVKKSSGGVLSFLSKGK
jgi:pilus assembly protein CpaE